MRCPRCSGTLQRAIAEQIDVHICDSCTGTLLRQQDLVGLLKAIARSAGLRAAPDIEVEPIPDAGQRLACPRCSKSMNSFGYMGMSTVIVDRCSDDNVIWADPDELGVMAQLMINTDARQLERHQTHQHARERLAMATSRPRSGSRFRSRSQPSVSFDTVSSRHDLETRMLMSQWHNPTKESRRRPSIWEYLEKLLGGGDDDDAAAF